MKKIKSTLALFFALLFMLSPTLLACGTTSSSQDSNPQDSAPQSHPSEEEESEPPSNEEIEPPLNELPSSPSSSSSSSSSETSDDPVPQTAQYIRCTGDNVNIRSGAGTDYAVLGGAKKGTVYAIIGKSGNWYKTYYRNKIAYIYASYASVLTLEKSEDEEVENVLSEGYKLIGVPYVYGAIRLHDGTGKLLKGFDAQKFDCSSLVQYVFYKGADAILNVNTRTQVKQGTYVAKSDLQRGDCIFFTNADRQYNTGVERVGHVAVYLGSDYILHTSSDYARIEKMTASRWKFYVEARRFL